MSSNIDRAWELREQYLKECKDSRATAQIEDTNFLSEYAEPGYDNPESGVIAFGNWNIVTEYVDGKFNPVDDTPARFADALEELGAEIEWGDEWSICERCMRAVRTQPDSHGWTPAFHIFEYDAELVCNECILEDYTGDYIEEFIGNHKNAMSIDIDLEDHGFVQWEEEFENGLYGGQADDPQNIAKHLNELGVERFVFKLDSVGQFDMYFSLWIDKDEVDKMKGVSKIDSVGVDPAEMAKRALKEGSLQSKELVEQQKQEGGVIYTKCKADGTAETRLVGPEEFVKEIKE